MGGEQPGVWTEGREEEQRLGSLDRRRQATPGKDVDMYNFTTFLMHKTKLINCPSFTQVYLLNDIFIERVR